MSTCVRLFAGAAIMLAITQAAVAQLSAPLPTTIGTEAQADALEKLARKTGDPLIPSCRFEGARCGYIDRIGNTVIAPQFDWADRFVADRARVRSAGKYGAIDATGRFAIAPAYDSMSKVDRGLVLVRVGDRLGVIDENGRWTVPAEHGPIIRLSQDAFLVAEPPYIGARRQLDWDDNRLLPYAPSKRWGIVASGGSWIVRPTILQVRVLSNDPNGLFWAADSWHTDARWQLMDSNGASVNNEWFDHVQQLQPVDDRAIVSRGGHWGAIDGKGKIVVALKFDWLGYFRDGWAPYRLAGREGRIDRDGNILSEAAAQVLKRRKVGAVVDDKPLYVDEAGAQLLGTDHPKCPDGRYLRFDQGRWTITAADDQPVPDIPFDYVDLACNHPSIVKHDGKWGFIAVGGKLLADRYFDHAQAFHGGIATVSDKGLWAVIGEDGSFLLGPMKLERAVFVSGTGEYFIELDEGDKTLDKAMVAMLARNPEPLIRRPPPRRPWSEGLAAQLDDKTGKWGFIDLTGKFIVAPQFDAAGSFTNGAAWAAIPDRREWCMIGKDGQVQPGTRCQCHQPLLIVEHIGHLRPDLDCYDEGMLIVRGNPLTRGMAN